MNSQIKETPEQQPQPNPQQVQQSVSVPVSVPVTVQESTLYISGDKRKMSTSPTSPQDNKRARLDNYQSTSAPSSTSSTTSVTSSDETDPLTTVISNTPVQAPSPTSPHTAHNLHHTHIPSKSMPQLESKDDEEEKLMASPYEHLTRSNMVSTPTVDVKTNSALDLSEDLNTVVLNKPQRKRKVEQQQQQQQQLISTSTDLIALSKQTSDLSPTTATTTTTTTIPTSTNSNAKKPAKVRKYRSRSLPNICFPTIAEEIPQKTIHLKSLTYQPKKYQQPPVNVQSLREIDLCEILKNPQLRHDILFDPQLQFRPNLDGERGKRKKIAYDKYWNSIKQEIEMFLNGDSQIYDNSKIPTLFTTLRDILISLLPSKDRQDVIDVLDIELIMQQMINKSLDFVGLSQWLSTIFKSHCAPMRDVWADEMVLKFRESETEKSVTKLVEGLRMTFTILEAMKLDVANHQIKLLKPVLVETAIEFERDYFQQIITRNKLDIQNSINWFKAFDKSDENCADKSLSTMIDAILSLLSCSKMVNEFPSSLVFDHSRLILFRASVRQLVCLQLCLALYRQFVFKYMTNPKERLSLLTFDKLNALKNEIIAIITDDNGNIKWTKNISSISLHLATKVTGEADEQTVEFGFSWLIKQTQPSSPVYSLMETRVFNEIKTCILNIDSDFSLEKLSKLSNQIPSVGASAAAPKEGEISEDVKNVAYKIALLTKFHWSVFNDYYTQP